jgi:hypothetical protein
MSEYVIDGYVFTSKAALGDAIRSILNSYHAGDTLAPDDADFMEDVLAMHPHASEKIGAGVKGFCVEINPTFKQKQFAVIRRDGTRTDFSFNKCLRAPTHKARFLQACRQAIAAGVLVYRTAYFANNPNPICELTGEYLTPNTSHVDHAPPHTFRWIAETFMQRYRVNVDTVVLQSGGDNSHTILMPKDLEALWIDYHWQYAQLRVISASENMRRGSHGVELPAAVDVSRSIVKQVRDEMLADGWRVIYGESTR